MPSRKAMTIMEVMFAIMITTIGLLGAISVFPVASEMARKGRLNDEVTIAADAVTHKFDAMGMRQPARWVALIDQSANGQPPQVVNGSALPTAFPATYWKTSFCIDPRFTAANLTAHANNEQNWTQFPAYPQTVANSPRMQRITLTAGNRIVNDPVYGQVIYPNNPATIMGRFQADHAFTIEDHLVYDRPKDNSRPAIQTYPAIQPNIPGKRDTEGRLTWMATMCPKMDSITGGRQDEYLLSVVIFDRRSPALATRDFTAGPIAPPFAEDRWPDNEWVVNIAASDFYGNGFGGGEVRLNADYAEKLNHIRSGSWIMLAGNYPAIPDASGSPTTTAPIFKWYKVSDVGDSDTATIGGVLRATKEATLIGPDWDVSGDAEATVMSGVVAVQERTVRLETDGNGF